MLHPRAPSNIPESIQLLTTRETCKAMGICSRSLYRITAPRGPLPVVRVNQNTLRYRVRDIEKYLEDSLQRQDDD